MACRRMLTKQGNQLRRWYHPSLSYIVHHSDEREESFQSPSTSRARYGLSNQILPRNCNGSSFGVNGGFGALSGGSKWFPAFFIPAGVGSLLYRYMSTSIGDSSDNADRIGDVAEPIADETVQIVSSQVPAVNEVAIAAADSAFPVAALQYLVDGMHSLTGLNWWAAIALTTILIRAATLPFLINQLKANYKLNLVRPRMEEIKQKVQASGMDPTAVAEGQKEMNALLKQYGVSPFTPLKGLLIQGPVFISFFFAISNMVEKVPSFKNGGALWFTDLTTPDSMFIFPILASLSFLVLVEFNMQEGFEGAPIASNMKKASRIFAILAVPFTMAFPKALFCYWITSNLFSLSYGLAIKQPAVSKFLDLPQAPIPSASTSAPHPQSESSSVPAIPPHNAAKEIKQPPGSSEGADRRTSSDAVVKQRIRHLEEKLKGNKGKKRKK